MAKTELPRDFAEYYGDEILSMSIGGALANVHVRSFTSYPVA